MADEQHKPMSNERLAEIRERFRRMTPPFQIATVYDAEAGFDLLAEVERSRAREAAAMEIVRAVASVPDEDYNEECAFCREQPGYTIIEHTPDCPVTKARALLAQ